MYFMKLYRFSPIGNEKQLIRAVKYVARQNSVLCKKVIGKSLPIASVTIFSHYPEEYRKLVGILSRLGSLHSENNGPRVVLHKPVKAAGNAVTHLRIRKPDPYRMQAGCSDFGVGNYRHFKATYLTKKPQNLRVIQRPKFEMIEFFDPDFDVLAYVLSKQIHNYS